MHMIDGHKKDASY